MTEQKKLLTVTVRLDAELVEKIDKFSHINDWSRTKAIARILKKCKEINL